MSRRGNAPACVDRPHAARQNDKRGAAHNGKGQPTVPIRSVLRDARDVSLRWRLSGVARGVLDANLTYLSPQKLLNLERCIDEVDREEIAGDFVECGVALGGSAILLASQLAADRRFRGYDVFATIPAPSDQDDEHAHQRYEVIRTGRSAGLGGEKYYGYIDNLYDVVHANFRRFGVPVDGDTVALRRGLFEESLPTETFDAIALAHIDCDWYEPVSFCLERIYRHLSPGGFIVLDDYADYGGCRRATDEFLARTPTVRPVRLRGNAVLRRFE